MKTYGHPLRNGTNVKSLFSARRPCGPRFAYHALVGAALCGRSKTIAANDTTADDRAHGVPVYLPPIPSLPGVDFEIEVGGVPAAAMLSAGRALPSGAWVLTRDEVAGLRLLPARGTRLSGPVTLRMTVAAADRATGRAASLSAPIEVAAPWGGAAAHSARYSLADDAGGRFEIDPESGLVSVADESLLDYAAERSHTIAVRVMAADGSFWTRRYKITLLDGAGEFSISDVVEEEGLAPKPRAEVVGSVAIDAGAAERVTFSLTDDAEGRFAIDAVTGVVTAAGDMAAGNAAPRQFITVQVASDEGWVSVQRFAVDRGEAGFVVSATPDEEEPEAVELPRLLTDDRMRRHNPALWELPVEFAA
jgi:hypothetical protein